FPAYGIDEDPVTGSAHTTLTPYWAAQLGKKKLSAQQLSKRGGRLICELQGDRTLISGQAITYLTGSIHLSNQL
ncbi:MAG: isomerase, partial [Bacteroidetes bacterium]